MQIFTIHVVEHDSSFAHFEKSADAERYMHMAMKFERDEGNEDWDISCALTSERLKANSWSDALAQLQFSYFKEDN